MGNSSPEPHDIGEVRSIDCGHCQIARHLRSSHSDNSITIRSRPDIGQY
jgi:hypothetical protein